MNIIREMVKVISISAALLCFASTAAMSEVKLGPTGNHFIEKTLDGDAASVLPQIQPGATGIQLSTMETFDGNDQSLMLGGQLNFHEAKSDWLVYITNGKLVMENRLAPQSLHYNDITWVKYSESEVLTTTENAFISVTVEGRNDGIGGAGILVGSGKKGFYLMFAVDGGGRYHIFKKAGRKLNPVHSAKHAAILVGSPNQLSFELRGAQIAFIVNGTEIIQVPNMKKASNSRQTTKLSGIGLAAFGTGNYTFDNVEIMQAN